MPHAAVQDDQVRPEVARRVRQVSRESSYCLNNNSGPNYKSVIRSRKILLAFSKCNVESNSMLPS